MTEINRDQRKIGGHRVATAFQMVVANPDPFNNYADRFNGTLVFNVRGGCLFVDNAELTKAQTRIFSQGPVATLNTLELDVPGEKAAVLNKIKIKLARHKTVEGEQGIVFKFLQSSEKHIELLNELVGKLPPVEQDTDVLTDQKRRSAL